MHVCVRMFMFTYMWAHWTHPQSHLTDGPGEFCSHQNIVKKKSLRNWVKNKTTIIFSESRGKVVQKRSERKTEFRRIASTPRRVLCVCLCALECLLNLFLLFSFRFCVFFLINFNLFRHFIQFHRMFRDFDYSRLVWERENEILILQLIN